MKLIKDKQKIKIFENSLFKMSKGEKEEQFKQALKDIPNKNKNIIYKLSYKDLETDITKEHYYNCQSKASFKAINLLNNLSDNEFYIHGVKAKSSPIKDIDNSLYPDMIRQRCRLTDDVIHVVLYNKIECFQMGYTTLSEDEDEIFDGIYSVEIERVEVE